MFSRSINKLSVSHFELTAYCIQCRIMLTNYGLSKTMSRIKMVTLSRMIGSSSTSSSTSETESEMKGKENGSQMSKILESEKKKESAIDSVVDDDNSEPDIGNDRKMSEGIANYQLGKRWLANMMGEDVETFTENKVQAAIRYLLPSHLFAKDAKPQFKHPSLVHPKKKEHQFAHDGRPVDAGFYTGEPNYHDLIYNIYKNMDKLEADADATIPTDNLQSTKTSLFVRWANHRELETILDENISETQYDIVMRRLNKLATHPQCYNLQDFLRMYQKVVPLAGKNTKVEELDEDGYSIAMGYRKTAIAEVKVKVGSGNMVVNDQPVNQYFPRVEDRQQLLFPFLVIDQTGRYDVEASVIGGGTTGQCGAIRLGISRALLSFSDSYRIPLDEAGLLIRDARRAERKKPGQKGARAKFAWVRR